MSKKRSFSIKDLLKKKKIQGDKDNKAAIGNKGDKDDKIAKVNISDKMNGIMITGQF